MNRMDLVRGLATRAMYMAIGKARTMSATVTATATVTVRSTIVRSAVEPSSCWKLVRLNSRTTADVAGLRYQNALTRSTVREPR